MPLADDLFSTSPKWHCVVERTLPRVEYHFMTILRHRILSEFSVFSFFSEWIRILVEFLDTACSASNDPSCTLFIMPLCRPPYGVNPVISAIPWILPAVSCCSFQLRPFYVTVNYSQRPAKSGRETGNEMTGAMAHELTKRPKNVSFSLRATCQTA